MRLSGLKLVSIALRSGEVLNLNQYTIQKTVRLTLLEVNRLLIVYNCEAVFQNRTIQRPVLLQKQLLDYA